MLEREFRSSTQLAQPRKSFDQLRNPSASGGNGALLREDPLLPTSREKPPPATPAHAVVIPKVLRDATGARP